MLRAVAYLRVSTEEQREGISLDAQRGACEQYIAARGWTLVHVYSDVHTGRRDDRSAFRDLRRNLAGYDAVVTWKLDRIARRTIDALTFVESCIDHDVAFVSTTQTFDTTEPIGKAALTMAAALAEVESDHIGERIRATKAKRVERGLLPWRPPYGYRRQRPPVSARNRSGPVVIDADEAAVIRIVFALRAEGLTHTAIAEHLRSKGLRKRGRSWTHSAVGIALSDPAYIGEPYTGQQKRKGHQRIDVPKAQWKRTKGLLPAIISKRLWDEARTRRLRGRRPSQPSLFRGLLVCGDCGTNWHVRSWGYGRTAYLCTGRRRSEIDCQVPPVKEFVILELLHDALRDLSGPGARAATEPPDEEHEGKRLTAAEQKAARAWTAYINGGVSIDVAMKAQREVGLAQAAVEIGAHPPLEGKPLREAVTACRKALKLKDIDEANRRLRGIVAKIVVRQDPARAELVFWAT